MPKKFSTKYFNRKIKSLRTNQVETPLDFKGEVADILQYMMQEIIGIQDLLNVPKIKEDTINDLLKDL